VYNEGSRNNVSLETTVSLTISFCKYGAERVNDLAGDIQCQLKQKYEYFLAHSIAVDESTDVKDIVFP
jgi:hypothetical protein